MNIIIKTSNIEAIIISSKYETLKSLSCSKNFLLKNNNILPKNTLVHIYKLKKPCLEIKLHVKSILEYSGTFIVLECLQNLRYIGEIVRTAFSLGVYNFIIISSEITWYEEEIIKHSSFLTLGAVNLFYYEDSKSFIRDINNIPSSIIITLIPRTENFQISLKNVKSNIFLVVGNEINGVSDYLIYRSNVLVSIAMKQYSDSLPTPVSVGIFINNIIN